MFPDTFSSQKEYDSYLACLDKLRPGDIIEATTNHGKIIGTFLFKEQFCATKTYRVTEGYKCYNLLIGIDTSKDIDNYFYLPSPIEKRRFLAPAKKECPKILIGSTSIYWIPNSTRIDKIVKYNGEQEKKEKKEKAKAAKSIRISRLHA